jgi:ribosomal-protein-alanine N-acetyltransferase
VKIFDAYTAIMADPEIGKWFPKGEGYSREEAKKSFSSIREHWIRHGFGIWAILYKRKRNLIGRCGLNLIDETSEVEIDFLAIKVFLYISLFPSNFHCSQIISLHLEQADTSAC